MIRKEYDIIIVGGGTGGVCAAAALCGTDYRVAIIEENFSLGGTTTEGFVSTWIEGVNLDFHVTMFKQLLETGNAMGNIERSWLPSKFIGGKDSCIIRMNPMKISEYYRKLFDDAANVDVYYNSSFEEVSRMEADAITEIAVSGKNEKYIFTAKYFIDASGDGVLCRSAAKYLSCADEVYYIGRDARDRFNESLAMSRNDDELLNEPSLFFELTKSEVDSRVYQNITTVYAVYSAQDGEKVIEDDVFLNDELFAKRNYDLDKIRIVKPDYIIVDGYRDVLLTDGGWMYFCNPMCGAGVTGYEYLSYPKEKRYEILKNKTREYWKYIKYSLTLANRKGETGYWNRSGWSVSEHYLNMTDNFAKMCGVRESYRIKCHYMLSQNDLIKDVRQCNDTAKERYVAVGSHNVDMHNQTGLSGIYEFNQSVLRPYGIKYDSLVPIFLSNTLIGCKAFGASQIAVSSARVVKTVSQIGWVCGCAIKLCLDEDLKSTMLSDLLVTLLQSDKYTGFTKYHSVIKNS